MKAMMMTSTWPIGTLGIVAVLMAAALNQGNMIGTTTAENIGSTERYLLRM